jgi:hypothetical protein
MGSRERKIMRSLSYNETILPAPSLALVSIQNGTGMPNAHGYLTKFAHELALHPDEGGGEGQPRMKKKPPMAPMIPPPGCVP